MSDNDFNADYPPEKDIGAGRRVRPPVRLEPDVRTQGGVPVSPDPIEPLEPIGHLEPIGPGDSGSGESQPGYGNPQVDTGEEAGSGKGQAAKDEARGLAQDGKDSAMHVADTAKREAGEVVEEAKERASNLFDELGTDIRDQAATQQEKISGNLREISDELRSMLDSSDASGTAATLVEQASRHSGNAADWLGGKEPGDLVNEVKDFARRRPGAFLGLALGAGLLVGRITRNAGGGTDAGTKNTKPAGDLPETGEPRTASPLPPTVNPATGTGMNPGVDGFPSAMGGTAQGYTAP